MVRTCCLADSIRLIDALARTRLCLKSDRMSPSPIARSTRISDRMSA
jgi:hypothetical protein